MFVLRFFAGPIVHRINPLGLLVSSALLGTLGLYLLGLPMTNEIWAWVGAVTIYGIGKTFYWPTLLGVVSERFPRGGALALGISGGIGMLSAGYFGGPGIGYKQDLFAVQKINELDKTTYERYVSRDASGAPAENGFPIFTRVIPETLPSVAGMDNGKLKQLDDYNAVQAGKQKTTTLEDEIALLQKSQKSGVTDEKILKSLKEREDWWNSQGQPNAGNDKPKLDEARLFGAKQALLYTALVPAALVVGFLLLFFYFAVTGGYKQVEI